MQALRAWLSNRDDSAGCGCETAFRDQTLVVDADACETDGRLAESETCRAAVVTALAEREADEIRTERSGLERVYRQRGTALFEAAGRFVDRARFHDDRIADRARRDPLAAAREAAGRADAIGDIAAETALAEVAAGMDGYDSGLSPFEGPALSRWRVAREPPDAPLDAVRELDSGATVRIYGSTTEGWTYHITPKEHRLGEAGTTALAAAAERLADGAERERAAHRAVREVADGETPVEAVTAVLRKHTRGYGLLEDFFADPELSDAFVTAPAAENPVRVVVDGTTMGTNVRLASGGVSALASRFRRESGRAFSRADPTLDATITVGDRRTRVAGLAPPVSDGLAFAFRAHDRETWRLAELVANDTLTPPAAALLSLAVERGRSVLLAGSRGAGKTTMLGALLWEIPSAVRTVVIEDTPELPVGELQSSGRDVQALRTGESGGEISPTEALRSALRLGDGALVLGEVRGEEAAVLYEAMRVGANSEAVLGTIHGGGGADVYERVVADLGVSPSAFGTTDLVVTLECRADGTRRLRAVEEVIDGEEVRFEPLFERDGGLVPTGRIDRGNSRFVSEVARPGESYGAVRSELGDRTAAFSRPDTEVGGWAEA